ncbi:TPA: Lrp/AsnC family transcriptional regulator [Candidatus Woesearchaeota archaeon]|nr:Lrp/AsnC family transcriptional regulator [Candidatus Woesearchaeota archaeon]
MNTATDLDSKDNRILDELQRDAKATTGKIAKRTAIPVTTVHNRIKRMEAEGVIKRYAPVLDYAKLGKGIHAMIFISAEHKADQEHLAKRLLTIEGVTGARIITGGYDIVIETRVSTIDALNTLITKELRKIQGVEKTQTMIVLEEVE